MKLYRGQKNSDTLEMNDPEMKNGSNIGEGYFFTSNKEFAEKFGDHIIEMIADPYDIIFKNEYNELKAIATSVVDHAVHNCLPINELTEGMALGHKECFCKHKNKHFLQLDDDEFIYYPLKRTYTVTVDLFSVYPTAEASSKDEAMRMIEDDIRSGRWDWNEWIHDYEINPYETSEFEPLENNMELRTYTIWFSYPDENGKRIEDETEMNAFSTEEAISLAEQMCEESNITNYTIDDVKSREYNEE